MLQSFVYAHKLKKSKLQVPWKITGRWSIAAFKTKKKYISENENADNNIYIKRREKKSAQDKQKAQIYYYYYYLCSIVVRDIILMIFIGDAGLDKNCIYMQVPFFVVVMCTIYFFRIHTAFLSIYVCVSSSSHSVYVCYIKNRCI